MALFAVMVGDRVNKLVGEKPDYHSDVAVYDVTSVSGVQENWVRTTAGTFVAPPPPPLDDETRSHIKDMIDRSAENCRTQYITPGAGQAAVYLAKQAEADALQSDTKPDPANYPFLSVSVGVEIDPTTGKPCADVKAVAALVRGTAAAWTKTAADIEGKRMVAKKAVDAATTYADAVAVMNNVAWPMPSEAVPS